MNDDDNIYGPYTLPEVNVHDYTTRPMTEAEKANMVKGGPGVLEYLMGGPIMRSKGAITTVKDIIKNRTKLGVNKELDEMTKKMQEYAEVAQKLGSGYNALSILERAFNMSKSNEALMSREPIIGADPYSPQYSGEGYRTIDGKVYAVPETELDYIFGPLFSGDVANPNFPSKFSLLERAMEREKERKRNE
tara:strand:- start:10526 stop:11098 length:573 start_codon:yes stop_codon:yes gene_type:complete